MPRLAFKMYLDPGRANEYKRRHDAIWPDLAALLAEAGVGNYSIFLDEETDSLFAYLEHPERHGMDDLPGHPVMRRWWAHMKDIMRTHPGGEPVVVPLPEMFYMAGNI